MHYGIGAPEKWALTLESPPLLNTGIWFQFRVCLPFLLSYFSVFNSSTTILISYIRLKFQVKVSGLFWGNKLHSKSWFQAKNFWPAAYCNESWGVRGVSNLRRSELMALWRSETLLPSTVHRRSVYGPFLQTKQPCSPRKSLRWFGKHQATLNKGSWIIDFPHSGITKISYLVTYFMKTSGINSFPLNVEKSEFLALALIEKEDLPQNTFKIYE